MADEIIGMDDMEVIFSITDPLGIHRESVSVDLTKEDPGSVGKSAKGTIEITVPSSNTIQEFSMRLDQELKQMGYVLQDSYGLPADDEEETEGEDDWLRN